LPKGILQRGESDNLKMMMKKKKKFSAHIHTIYTTAAATNIYLVASLNE
jgi:hypothetical protein